MCNWGEVRWRIPVDHFGGEGLTRQQREWPPPFKSESFLREDGNKPPERIAMNPKLRATERPHDVVCAARSMKTTRTSLPAWPRRKR